MTAQQVIVTVRHTDRPSMDLALPYDIPSQVVAEAVAQVIGLPVSEDHQYAFIRIRGKERKPISSSETLGEAHVSYGEYLELSQQIEDVPFETVSKAMLRMSNGRTASVLGEAFLLGRKTPVSIVDLDLTEIDDARVVSKKHATLLTRDGRFFLRDHGSTNGTCVNNIRLRREEDHELFDQDLIELGGPQGVKLAFILNL